MVVIFMAVGRDGGPPQEDLFISFARDSGWSPPRALDPPINVLHDEDLAQAIVDRVLERGRLLLLDGPSMRTKHLGFDNPLFSAEASTQGARISRNPQPGSRTFSNFNRYAFVVLCLDDAVSQSLMLH